MDEGEQSLGTAPGSCHLCHRWTWSGTVIAEIHSDSGYGATVVRCGRCSTAADRDTPPPQHRRTS